MFSSISNVFIVQSYNIVLRLLPQCLRVQSVVTITISSSSRSSVFVIKSLMTSVVTLIKLYDIVLMLLSLCLRVECDVIIGR